MKKIVPIYMLPTVFITMNEMPVPVSAKLDPNGLRFMILGMSEMEFNDHRLEDFFSSQTPSTSISMNPLIYCNSVIEYGYLCPRGESSEAVQNRGDS
jgi:hypothetical protein